jgi:flagellar biosynthesis protein
MKDNQKEKKTVAAALRYDPRKDSAPALTAKGSGWIADKIIDLAEKNDIPIKKDPNLVQILSHLEIDQKIPPSLYYAVAEILSYIYSMNNRWRERENCRP